MRSTARIALLVVAMAGTAAAQPGLTPPNTPLPPPAQPGEELSENTAVLLSLGGTAASWTLLAVASDMGSQDGSLRGNLAKVGVVGSLLAPSFGHWYARSAFTRGLGLRIAGAAALTLALAMAIVSCEDECSGSAEHTAQALAIGGLALYVGGTLDDLATLRGAVRRENQRRHDVTIVPVIHRDSGGLAIAGRF